MKKLFGLVLALMCSMSMFAQNPECLYIVGDGTGNGWNLDNLDKNKLEKVNGSDNIYEWTGPLYHCDETEGRKEGFKILSTRDWNPAMHPSEAKLNIDTKDGGDVVRKPYSGDPDTKWNVSKDGYYKIRVTLRAEDALVECEKAFVSIATADELADFASKIGDGTYPQFVNAKLTADINYTSHNNGFIGVPGKAFRGEFDGQEHTIQIAITNANGVNRTGLFAAIDGATIKNLVVEGSATSNDQNCVGGLGGRSDGTSTIENVIVKTAVSYTGGNGDATCGGFFANMEGTATLNNCAFLGSISTGSSNGNGGLVGWAGSGSNNKYYNCLVAPTQFDQSKGDIFARNNPTKTNCHFVASDDTRLASGELCYILNNLVSGGENWYQTLPGDATPVPFATHSKVYAKGAQNCDGSSKGSVTYSNTPGDTERDPHNYVDGFCSACHDFQTDFISVVDGWYEISTPAQLRWAAEAVTEHNATYGNKNYKLTADINYSAYTDQAAMFGKPSNTFKGTFDGQNHTVTVAFNNTAADETALFRRINGGTVKNLKVDGTITTNKSFAAGIVSGIWQTGTIQNCEAAVTITDEQGGDGTHGGILARMNDNNNAGTNITNCHFSGTLNIPNRTGSGAIIGWPNFGSSNVHVKNCLVTGTLNMKTGSDNDVICRNEADVQNCYYLALNGVNNSKSATAATAAQAESGELTYLLNGSVNGGENWFQKKSVDNVPTPFATGDNKIYANGTQKCDGTPDATTFDNTDTGLTVAPHVFAANNLCTACHKAGQEPSNVDGVYQIATIGHLVWFADHVNGGATTAAADVTADIAQGEAIYTPIGSQANPYQGVFKGGFHTITLALNNFEYTNQGIFGMLTGGATIYNLTAAGTVSASSAAGGIAGCANGGGTVQFINVGNEAAVTTTGNNAGGILGVDMGSSCAIKMLNCYNAGTITGASDNGGLSGWAGDNAEYINCYTIGTVKGSNSNQFSRQNSATYNNVWHDGNGVFDMAASGELCYRLGDSNFRQQIGTDAHPVLSSTKPNVYAFSVGEAGWRTLVAERGMDFSAIDGATAYHVVSTNNDYVTLDGSIKGVPAGEAVLVEAAEGEYYYNACNPAGTPGNLLVAATEAVTADGSQYVLANETEGVGFYKVTPGTTIAAGKGYLVVPAGAKMLRIGRGDVDAIEGVIVNKLDGTSALYNLQGQKLQNLQKGINIVNGKKILVK